MPPAEGRFRYFAGIDDASRSAHHQLRSPFRLGDHGDTCPRQPARAFFQDQWDECVVRLRRGALSAAAGGFATARPAPRALDR